MWENIIDDKKYKLLGGLLKWIKIEQIISVVALFLLFLLYLYAVKSMSDNQTVSNIILYIGAVIVFMVFWVISEL